MVVANRDRRNFHYFFIEAAAEDRILRMTFTMFENSSTAVLSSVTLAPRVIGLCACSSTVISE